MPGLAEAQIAPLALPLAAKVLIGKTRGAVPLIRFAINIRINPARKSLDGMSAVSAPASKQFAREKPWEILKRRNFITAAGVLLDIIPFTIAGALTLSPNPAPAFLQPRRYRGCCDQISQLGTYLLWRSAQRRTSCANVVRSMIWETASSTFRHSSVNGVSALRFAVRVRAAWEPST